MKAEDLFFILIEEIFKNYHIYYYQKNNNPTTKSFLRPLHFVTLGKKSQKHFDLLWREKAMMRLVRPFIGINGHISPKVHRKQGHSGQQNSKHNEITGWKKITLVLLKSKYFQGLLDFLQKTFAIKTVKRLQITCTVNTEK